jgi:hypothetical protein
VKDESTISKILNGFKAEFITTVTEFSKVTEDTFTDKYLENSVGIAQVGLRIKLLDIHKTLRESTKESRSQNPSGENSIRLSEFRRMEKEVEEFKKFQNLPSQVEQVKHLPDKNTITSIESDSESKIPVTNTLVKNNPKVNNYYDI